MGIVTLATWKKYARKPDDDAAGEALYQTFLDAAETIVEEHLGFDPVSQTYTAQALVGTGFDSLQLKAKPITVLTSVSVDGVLRTVADFLIEGERITDKNGLIFPAGSAVLCTYTAGYATIPALISLTIMDIASLLSMNQGDNIGVSSVTFDGGNTRQFINYNTFAKQLSRLANIRLVRAS